MKILIDKAQQNGKHELKHGYFKALGIDCLEYPLPCGDYVIANEKALDVIQRKEKRGVAVKKMDFLGTYTICVDTKKDLQEIVGNICGQQHLRFRDECILSQNNGIKLIVLVENEDGVKKISDLEQWQNPRAKMTKWVTTPSGKKRKVLVSPDATKGSTLAKAMRTMEEKYGVKFEFCKPEEAGKRIVELLSEVT